VPNTVLWLRRDLRLGDLPALGTAHHAAGGARVLPLFVLDPRLWAGAGAARRGWLSASLRSLHSRYDGALVVRVGSPSQVVPEVAREVRAASVHVSAESTPYGRRRDAAVRRALEADGRALVATGTAYAVGPGTIATGAGTPYQVFTPFVRAWRAHGWPPPAPVPAGLRWVRRVDSQDLPEAGGQLPALPTAGEWAALERWHAFLEDGLTGYADRRDRPDLAGTSGLSGHLKFGEIHPRTLLAGIAAHPGGRSRGAQTFIAELAWREFYADVLWHRPDSAWADLRPALAGMAYEEPAAAFEAWKAGRTGYPLVDAGMRQLLAEGWMHNRVRMVAASFLVKDLHIWWPHGARHFLEHLRDGDVASNSHGWQWAAGTGTDASPFFRVFNPVSQARRFDPEGDYVRRYVPELAHLPGASAHEPWTVEDGYARGYPERVVDHAEERTEALRRYAAVRGRRHDRTAPDHPVRAARRDG
jgi:deoxyribodipyrimidine photo-lyase